MRTCHDDLIPDRAKRAACNWNEIHVQMWLQIVAEPALLITLNAIQRGPVRLRSRQAFRTPGICPVHVARIRRGRRCRNWSRASLLACSTKRSRTRDIARTQRMFGPSLNDVPRSHLRHMSGTGHQCVSAMAGRSGTPESHCRPGTFQTSRV